LSKVDRNLFSELERTLADQGQAIQTHAATAKQLTDENHQLKARIEELESQLNGLSINRGNMDWSHLQTMQDDQVRQLTGFKNFDQMKSLFLNLNSDNAMDLQRYHFVDEQGECKHAAPGRRSNLLSSENRWALSLSLFVFVFFFFFLRSLLALTCLIPSGSTCAITFCALA
jgi:predicted RNase H-like nuclease (RuvC/YqgF family)